MFPSSDSWLHHELTRLVLVLVLAVEQDVFENIAEGEDALETLVVVYHNQTMNS